MSALSELMSCVKVEVAVLGSLSLIVLMVSVDVKQHSTNQLYCVAANTFKTDGSDRMTRGSEFRSCVKVEVAVLGSIVQELCESRGGRPGLSVLTSLLVSVDVKNY